jgi:hypothetical protein
MMLCDLRSPPFLKSQRLLEKQVYMLRSVNSSPTGLRFVYSPSGRIGLPRETPQFRWSIDRNL